MARGLFQCSRLREGSAHVQLVHARHRFANGAARPNTITDDAIDVRVHGFVGKDGRPYSLKVLDNPRTDLSQEALKIVAQWAFEPAQCNYKPSTMETDFVVHFKGW
jgi:hypothetical protein